MLEPRFQRGYSLAEALTVLGILALLALVTLPAFANMNRRMALRAATADLRSLLHETRSRAIAANKHHGLKFTESGGIWHITVYDDGDGDGIRNEDIKKSIDRPVAAPRPVFRESRIIAIGLPQKGIKDPDGDPLKGPVAFNRSTICSFSPIGAATPGSIYLTDGHDLWCVRVSGATARIRVLRYDLAKKRWIQ